MTDKNWQQILRSCGYPTTTVTLDFETFWSKDYTLNDMSMVEYVMDDRFDFTGMGVFACHQPFADPINCLFIPPERIEDQIRTLQRNYGDNWEGCTYVNQNIMFDGLILKEKFGIIPRFTVDTLNLARHEDSRRKNSLSKLCEYYDIGTEKGDTSISKGLHWKEMSPTTRKKWREYTDTDIIATTKLFRVLLPMLSNPKTELRLQQHTLEMYLTPRFEFDFELAGQLMDGMHEELDKALMDVKFITKYATKKHKEIIDIVRGQPFELALKDELRRVGERLPMKKGKNSNIVALAQTDVGFQKLLKHKDDRVRALAIARKSAKSWPTHIKRLQSMWNQAKLRNGMIAAALLYYGGHTGRWSGTQGNPQNLPGAGRTGEGTHPLMKQMRNCLKAPKGNI